MDLESRAGNTKYLDKNEGLTLSTSAPANVDAGSKEPTDEKLEDDTLAEAESLDGDDDFVEGCIEGWKSIFGCALIAAPSIGWNLMWGVFQEYHSKHFLAGTSTATLSAVGATQNAILAVLGFVAGKLGDRHGYKPFIAAGCVTVFLGQLCASFCHNFWSIFLTQGVMQGLGTGVILPMIFSIPSKWFRKHRGAATGIVIAGSSLGSAVPSLVVQAMLTRIGFHKTLLIYSFVQGAVMLVGFVLIKTRSRKSQPQAKRKKIDGYLTPFVYISVYTGEKLPHISSQLANLPISIISFASAIGRTSVGISADRIGFINAFILVLLFSSFCQAVLWNFAAESYAGIMVFSILYGLSGPCLISLITPVATTLYGTHNLATLTGLMNMSNLPGAPDKQPRFQLVDTVF
ncbi:hypothetical protein FS749_004986 [Ceratobasidium sp. UAMH 11750]|nr:hypothetical protein FS749_004986 [Ceratobasidium sp. UAMH 11750]